MAQARKFAVEHVLSVDNQTGEVRDRWAVNLVVGRMVTRVAKFASEAEAGRFADWARLQDTLLAR